MQRSESSQNYAKAPHEIAPILNSREIGRRIAFTEDALIRAWRNKSESPLNGQNYNDGVNLEHIRGIPALMEGVSDGVS